MECNMLSAYGEMVSYPKLQAQKFQEQLWSTEFPPSSLLPIANTMACLVLD